VAKMKIGWFTLENMIMIIIKQGDCESSKQSTKALIPSDD